RTDGRQLVLQHPVLRGDTLVGISDQQEEVRIALTDVRQVATRGFSAGRTVGLGVGLAAGVVGAFAAAYLIGCSNGGCNWALDYRRALLNGFEADGGLSL